MDLKVNNGAQSRTSRGLLFPGYTVCSVFEGMHAGFLERDSEVRVSKHIICGGV